MRYHGSSIYYTLFYIISRPGCNKIIDSSSTLINEVNLGKQVYFCYEVYEGLKSYCKDHF